MSDREHPDPKATDKPSLLTAVLKGGTRFLKQPGGQASGRERHQRRVGKLFVVPGVLLFVVFVVYPLLATILQSFFSVQGGGVQGMTRDFVGLEWYQEALTQDDTFRTAMRNSLLWSLWSIFVDIPVAFGLAYLLWKRIPGWRFYRLAWFIPYLMAGIMVGQVWRWILRLDGGLVNIVLDSAGLGAWQRDWLGEPVSALLWLMVMTTWQAIGFYMVLFHAALEEIPTDLLDAAVVDGASSWRVTRSILVPLLRPITMTAVIITFISKMKVFDLVWATTRGGPLGETETVITWVIKRAFYAVGNFDLGYPAAMATIWLFAMAVGSWLLHRLLRPKEVYEY